MKEIWDAYDRFHRKTGEFIMRGEKIPEGVRHMVVHMIYYNDKGEILIQKRSSEKELAPGVWAFTGGSALAGEDSLAACIRETREELGFEPDMSDAELILSFSRKDCFTDVYLIKTDINEAQLMLQESEVDEARWFNKSEFYDLLKENGAFWKYSYLPMVTEYLEDVGYLR